MKVPSVFAETIEFYDFLAVHENRNARPLAQVNIFPIDVNTNIILNIKPREIPTVRKLYSRANSFKFIMSDSLFQLPFYA